MLKTSKNWLLKLGHKHPGFLLVVLMWFLLALTNYEPGTWLLGWDVMATEFNPALNIKRALIGTWQEFQGLGLLGGHGYNAQLPHALFQFFLSQFIPMQYLRYVFAFLMLFLGGAGSYFLTFKMLSSGKSGKPWLISLASSIGGAVYLLHLGTVQTFYVHLEPFIVMYGLLPWALISLFGLLEKFSAKRLLVFLILNFFLSTIGFVPPVFISYAFFVAIILAVNLILKRGSKKSLQQAVLIVLTIAAANLYWLIPVGLFSATQQDHYLEAKLNSISTTEFNLTSEKYGTLSEVALIKGFLFDSMDQDRFDLESELAPVMQPWIRHLENPAVRVIGYAIFALAIAGAVLSLFQLIKTRNIVWSIGLLGPITFSLLAISVFPFSLLRSLVQYIPVINQAFRIPYSKLSMSASLFFAILAGVAVYFIFQSLIRFTKDEKIWRGAILTSSGFILLFLTLYSVPSFTGSFIYRGNRVELPQEYLELMAFLEGKPTHQRIAPFPIYTYTGWEMHRWNEEPGLTGSGFLWYGIEQPILSRSFDVWSPYNETYRLQMQQAVYDQDAELLLDLLRKYQISYVLVDDSIYLPGSDEQVFRKEDIKGLLEQIPNIQLAYSKQNLHLYQVNSGNLLPIEVPETFSTVQNLPQRTKSDVALVDMSASYLESDNASLQYPFAFLLKESVSASEVIFNEDKSISIKQPLKGSSEPFLKLPNLSAGEFLGQKVTAIYRDNELSIRFESPVEIVSEGFSEVLPSLGEFSFEVPEDPAQLEIFINSKSTLLDLNSQSSFVVNDIFYQEPVYISFFDPIASTTTESQVLVPEDEIVRQTISSENWSLPVSGGIPLGDSSLELKIYTQPTDYLELLKQYEPANCSSTAEGSINTLADDQGLSIESENGAIACIGIPLYSHKTDKPLLLELDSDTEAGRSLKFYLKDEENRVVLEHLVQNSSEVFPLISWDTPPQEYNIAFENRSFGTEISKNVITDFKAHSLPVDIVYLASISVSIPEDLINSNGLEITNIKKWGTFWYQTELNEVGDGTKALILNQAYSPFWIANISDSDHQRYMGWANGWTWSSDMDDQTKTVNLVFWPQLMVFIAYGLLLIWMGALVIISFKQRGSSKTRFASLSQLLLGNLHS